MTRLPTRLATFTLLASMVTVAAERSAAQDTTQANDKIRVILEYQPGIRPGLVVLPGSGLDSARAIIRRDLDYSDRFEMVVLPDVPPTTARRGDSESGGEGYGIYKTMGAQYGVEIVDAAGGATVRLHDLNASQVRKQQTFALPPVSDPAYRLELHRVADEVARWATGTAGIAASRVLFVSGGRVYRMDSDGEAITPLTPAGQTALSPAWAPDGQRFAYTQLGAGRGGVVVQTLGSGATVQAPGTAAGLNITPSFAPDGRLLAYAHSDETGTDIYLANVADRCCAQRLTVGRYADNLSPTLSPDGRRIAFVSTRAGPPQVYVMAADGTDQELLAPFDYGATGSSNGPEWSPDGANVVFHREVAGSPQLFLVNVAGRRVRQLTSSGRNEDPTWGPDGRHITFVSDRSGRRQLWVVDVETARVRQLQTPGAARLPAWSRRLSRTAVAP
ncbi:MAG: PD40 domain-containing protein [Gemmatimonadales bacterium]|nr:PD40 domain-containing protein [Gemmatimonadales bacterium]